MNFTLLSSIMTMLSMIVFIGIIFWAFNKKNKSKFEEIGRLLNDNENDNDNSQIELNKKNSVQNKDGQ
jgi:cytochrome c oxidase cbb3-type subunit 4